MAIDRNAYDLIQIFYGINPNTNEIDSVWHYRNGTLSKSGAYGIDSCYIHPRNVNNPAAEISIVWGVTDLIPLSPALIGSETQKEVIASLKEKAAAKAAIKEV
jgi:hypothetical protein